MIRKATKIVLLLIVAQFFNDFRVKAHSREKRFLVVPPTSPTRHQLISGVGIPLTLENESITLGLTLKAQYFLPENANQLKWIYFPGIFGNYTPINFAETQQLQFPYGRRKREVRIDELSGQKYEKYLAEVQETGNEALESEAGDAIEEDFVDEETLTNEDFEKASDEELLDTSGSRWLMYDGLGQLLNSKGFNGRPCVLRGICEAAETKFTYHSGLFGELLHLIFTPSTTHDPIINHDHNDYVKAELLGAAGESCGDIFHECKKSLMEIFTQVHDSSLYKF